MGLALVGLVLGAEVAAAALLAVEGVAAHQLAELEEVVDAAGLLERLVDARRRLPVTSRSFLNSSCRAGISDSAFSSPAGRAVHAAVVPDDLAELAVEVVGTVGAADRHVAA